MVDPGQDLRVDARDPMPIYAQLDRRIRTAIAAGRLQTGEQLPTVRQLAVDLRINANTVARVYAQLERDGVLQTRRGVGSFIAEPAARASQLGDEARRQELQRLVQGLLAEAGSLGFTTEDVMAALARSQSKGVEP
jgi:GntR family transcriptional regulator